jgi:hypothetical protein
MQIGLNSYGWLLMINDDIHGVCISSIVKHPNYNVRIVNMATGHDLPLWVIRSKNLKSGL